MRPIAWRSPVRVQVIPLPTMNWCSQGAAHYWPSAAQGGEQLAAVDSLIDSMMLVEGEGEEMEDLFEVSSIPNPQFQRLFQCLHHRALNPSAPLPSPEPWLKGMLERPQEVTARCTAPLQQLRQRFPLQEAVRKKEQKTAQDIFGDVTEEEPSTKKARQDEDEKFHFAGLAEGIVTAAGNVELYNSYLQTLKKNVQERALQDFWELLVQDNITLISKDEVEGSTVSKMEANQFLAPEQKPDEQTAPPADDGGDVDDLLDMINEEEPGSKKARQYEDEKFNLAGLTEGTVTAVGSVDPGRDFRVLMRQKSLPFSQVCQQLTSRVDQLLGTKSTQYYMKSISCIKAFREESSKAGDVEPYNSYLQTLKKNVQERALQDFWELLVQDNITLISKDEVEGSTVSKMEANQFLAPEQKPDEQTAPPADDGGDVDDLLDMM
ncbi:UNVERIFIED_CONTAM: hypothetical protein FKN15_064521 [Acipenser sinensis]